jgi:hypothetical protein
MFRDYFPAEPRTILPRQDKSEWDSTGTLDQARPAQTGVTPAGRGWVLRRGLVVLLAGWLASTAALPHAEAGEVSFRNDVMAVLSKAGCNLGVCHGNKNGKGGFLLSLRGENPEFDFAALSRDFSARRTNAVDPDQSLILLKATMQIAHEGGRRFTADSDEYAILHRWIAAGMPRDADDAPHVTGLHVTPSDSVLVEPESEVQLQAVATFSDGSRRDMTARVVYEPAHNIADVTPGGLVRRGGMGEDTITVRYLNQQVPVRVAFVPARPDFVWSAPEPANMIDEHVFDKLKKLRMNPSPECDDTVFMRRAYFDLLGMPPTAEKAREFVTDSQPDKRARLIDELLERQEFADFWAMKWSDLLRNEEKTLDRKGVQNFYHWIRHSIASGKPLNQFARELIAARGDTYDTPAANFYRAMRDPLTRSETAAQVFLGVRLQCAKCHNHPFDRWTMDDYYSWGNFFSRVEYEVIENNRRDRNDKHEFDGRQIVYIADKGEVKNARTGSPSRPRFLGADTPEFTADQDRLVELADWIADPNNRQFAEVQVNRIWFNLLGRGIVDPIDDFRATNPPSHPELLRALAEEFQNSNYDLRHMIRLIMNSRTYQLSAVPNETNADDERNFARSEIRRLSAEQMADALSRALDAPIEYNGYPRGMRAGELPGIRAVRYRDKSPSTGDQFLILFGKPPRLQACECERSDESTLSQAFQLVSGQLMNELLTRKDNRLSRLLESSGTSSVEIIEELYWAALSRPPNEEELAGTVRYLDESSDRRSALEDIAWSLINANEFMLRQ